MSSCVVAGLPAASMAMARLAVEFMGYLATGAQGFSVGPELIPSDRWRGITPQKYIDLAMA